MSDVVLLNGAFVTASEARISVFDGGFLHGAGLFETMRADRGHVFRLESHLARLRRSAETLLRSIDRALLPSAALCRELLGRCGLSAARLRLTVSSGSLRGDPPDEPPAMTVCLTASPLAGSSPEQYQRGVAVCLNDARTSPSDRLAGHKCTAYLPRLLGLREAQRRQCMESLWFTTAKHLAEGCISNVFLVKDGALRTPPLTTPVLPGIARGVVLDIARADGREANEVTLGIGDLLDADEVFLTNAIVQVMPVVRVERRDIGDGRVGPVTKRMLDAYRETAQSEGGAE